MCYHTTLSKHLDRVTRYLETPMVEEEKYTPYFCLNGFTHDYVYIVPQNDPKHMYAGSWGLVPDYALNAPRAFYKDGKYNTLNARGEVIFESRTYKNFIHQRCLIFADGFFEPHYFAPKKQQPYFCFLPDSREDDERKLFCFAGLYSRDDEGNYYVTQLTVEANEFFAEIHNKAKRMPLVLDDRYVRKWLKNDLEDNEVKDIIRAGFTRDDFEAYPVQNIYQRSIDANHPEILKPVPSLQQGLF